MRTADKHIYEKPEIKEICFSKAVDPMMTPPEYGSSKSWTGSCCFKDRALNEFSKHEEHKKKATA